MRLNHYEVTMLPGGWYLIKVAVVSSILSSLVHYRSSCDVIKKGEIRWQLFNQCSSQMLQTYRGHITARGHPQRKCLTEFLVHTTRNGTFKLMHAQSRTFVCFNKRLRITMRKDGSNERCFFREHIDEMGYTEIESSAFRGIYLGFNRRGTFQAPLTYRYRRKSFLWTKYERYVPNTETVHCGLRSRQHPVETTQTPLINTRDVMRKALLDKIRATQDGPYTPYVEDYDF